jgi:hypothetical protein
MPCDGLELTKSQEAVREEKLRDLEAQLKAGKVTVKLNGRTRKVEFVGWETDRVGVGHWHDDCAYRRLMAEGSSELRMALARSQTADRTITQAR